MSYFANARFREDNTVIQEKSRVIGSVLNKLVKKKDYAQCRKIIEGYANLTYEF
jgi:hypothetical protein